MVGKNEADEKQEKSDEDQNKRTKQTQLYRSCIGGGMLFKELERQ